MGGGAHLPEDLDCAANWDVAEGGPAVLERELLEVGEPLGQQRSQPFVVKPQRRIQRQYLLLRALTLLAALLGLALFSALVGPVALPLPVVTDTRTYPGSRTPPNSVPAWLHAR